MNGADSDELILEPGEKLHGSGMVQRQETNGAPSILLVSPQIKLGHVSVHPWRITGVWRLSYQVPEDKQITIIASIGGQD